jgi:O-antigen ligase
MLSAGRINPAADALERVFTIAALIFFTGAVLQVLYNPGGMSSVSTSVDPWNTRIQYFVYASMLALSLRFGAEMLLAIRNSYPIWILIGLSLVSTTWSTVPLVTLKSAIWLTLSTLFGTYFALRYDEDEQLMLLFATVLICALVSIFMLIAYPELGTEPGEALGSWRGAFTRKNSLGRLMALGVIVAILSARRSVLIRPVLAVSVAIFGILLVGSRSVTALIAVTSVGVSLLAVPALRSRRVPPGRTATFALAALAGVIAIIWLTYEPILTALGRDTRLTGRDTLWIAVVAKALLHPVLGYGHVAFWRGGSDYLDVWKLVGWSPPHAHNGFLDVTLELGLVGLIAMVTCLLFALWKALQRLKLNVAGRDGAWPFLYLLFFLTINLAETSTLRHTNIYWVLFAVAVTNSVRRDAPVEGALPEEKTTPTGSVV